MRPPFDNLTLKAVLFELRSAVGAKVQSVFSVDSNTIAIELYDRQVRYLQFSVDHDFYHLLLTNRKPSKSEADGFTELLRARLKFAVLESVEQLDEDRHVRLDFRTPISPLVLFVELMGKHANVILTTASLQIIGAQKLLPPSKSVRPLLPGREYLSPPKATGSRVSKFLVHLGYQELPSITEGGAFEVAGQGTYPLAFSPAARPVDSIGNSLFASIKQAKLSREFHRLQTSLSSSLERIIAARTKAVANLEAALALGDLASKLQREGELLLAYGAQIPAGSSSTEVYDYDGQLMTILLDPELTPLENAQKRFDKAKHAKHSAHANQDQFARLKEDLRLLRSALVTAQNAVSLEDLRSLESTCKEHKWLQQQVHVATKKERPFEGHRIRELLGPKGFRVLYGENAEANDYLTLRVAKPSDWWLHVRGNTSAHVIIPTGNQPERVPHDVLMYAAEIAVRNSNQKHSAHVPVDLTLKKYVRRQKGAPKGSVIYSHERTLHV